MRGWDYLASRLRDFELVYCVDLSSNHDPDIQTETFSPFFLCFQVFWIFVHLWIKDEKWKLELFTTKFNFGVKNSKSSNFGVKIGRN